MFAAGTLGSIMAVAASLGFIDLAASLGLPGSLNQKTSIVMRPSERNRSAMAVARARFLED